MQLGEHLGGRLVRRRATDHGARCSAGGPRVVDPMRLVAAPWVCFSYTLPSTRGYSFIVVSYRPRSASGGPNSPPGRRRRRQAR